MEEITRDKEKNGTNCEIEEEEEEEEEETNTSTNQLQENHVYVAVGKSESSMNALAWTLKQQASSSSAIVFLIHVFPEIHQIPTPLGKLPKGKVNPQQVEKYMSEEREKRREFLQKLLKMATGYNNVNIETMLIESNMVARSILDLIPVLNITKLVVGSSTKKIKIGTTAEQILNDAPDYCDVKIICQGKELITDDHQQEHKQVQVQVQDNISNKSTPNPRSSSCACFF